MHIQFFSYSLYDTAVLMNLTDYALMTSFEYNLCVSFIL